MNYASAFICLDAYTTGRTIESILFLTLLQVVTDVDLKINNIVCKWPGSTHDARIFDNSRLGTKFEDGEINEKIYSHRHFRT